MPKISHEGATAAGSQGHVVDAQGKVSELDPSLTVDGERVDGYEDADEREEQESASKRPARGGKK